MRGVQKLAWRLWRLGARTVNIVVGIIVLVDLNDATTTGIYTLWVLLPADAEAEYEKISRA